MIKQEVNQNTVTIYNKSGVVVSVNSFMTESSHAEYDAMIRLAPTMVGRPFSEQLQGVVSACDELRERLGGDVVPVFKRYFLSDASNQARMLPEESECAVSVVQQQPLDGTKIALWVYFQQGVEVSGCDGGVYAVKHGDYTDLWLGGGCTPDIQSEVATRAVLSDYELMLEGHGCTVADNCVRTWFFVRDVDVNYAGMVKGRNDMFATIGLTRDTHYIASTGIGGRNADPRVTVTMDAYAVKGLKPGQMSYLYAREWLNPTYEYGVAFERGACVDYGDRRHVFISGTASINNRGEVVYKGDIRRQTERMCENVEALLAEAGCDWKDVGHAIVYLRDVADYSTVEELLERRLPGMPHVIVLAPVCRPEWLVEMECMAVRCNCNDTYADF